MSLWYAHSQQGHITASNFALTPRQSVMRSKEHSYWLPSYLRATGFLRYSKWLDTFHINFLHTTLSKNYAPCQENTIESQNIMEFINKKN